MNKQNANITVAVGMSGGVDSSVSALLLKQQGFNVVGLFMKNWDEVDPDGVCTAEKDYRDVKKVCKELEIPYFSFNFESEYKDLVFKDFLEEYKAGYTPNPDVLCNREIKFKHFFMAAKNIGADLLATGHYAQVKKDSFGNFDLIKGADPKKDQSYFLHQINSKILEKVIFPIGHIDKLEVRKMAEQNNLITHDKKDSTGICFIGERDFKVFLKEYVAIKPGPMKNLKGEKVGQHEGIAFYTLGQRKGLGLGGQGDPFFVVAKDIEKNTLIVERGKEHPALFTDSLIAEKISWINKTPVVPLKCKAKVRYRQVDQECNIEDIKDGLLKVAFTKPQRAVTPGQFIVFYQNNICLGGGRIKETGPSYYETGKRP